MVVYDIIFLKFSQNFLSKVRLKNVSHTTIIYEFVCARLNTGVQNCAIATTTLNPTQSISCTRNRTVYTNLKEERHVFVFDITSFVFSDQL